MLDCILSRAQDSDDENRLLPQHQVCFKAQEGLVMAVCYNKLWNLVRQNKMKKGDLAKAAEISGYWMSKLNHDEPVQMEVMLRLCKVFHCDIGDLMEVIEEE